MVKRARTREEWEALLLEFPEEHADLLLSAASRVRQSIYGGGAHRVLKPCPKCRKKFSARDLRVHIPRCGVHIVDCRYGCGFTGNPLGTSQHEALCEKNPKNK